MADNIKIIKISIKDNLDHFKTFLSRYIYIVDFQYVIPEDGGADILVFETYAKYLVYRNGPDFSATQYVWIIFTPSGPEKFFDNNRSTFVYGLNGMRSVDIANMLRHISEILTLSVMK